MLGKTDCASRKDESVLQTDASRIQFLHLPNHPAPCYRGAQACDVVFQY